MLNLRAAFGALVATLAVNMSDTTWAFPFPPGSLSIGGTNSGGFTICNYNQICQSSGGTAAGTAVKRLTYKAYIRLKDLDDASYPNAGLFDTGFNPKPIISVFTRTR